MNSNITTLAKSYTTPWTLRAYDALPGNPFWIGIGFTIGLLLVFFVGRFLVEGTNNSTPDDLRVAIIHILQTAYSASAYAYLLMTARKTTHDLSPVARHAPQWQTIVDSAGKHSWWVLLLVGAATYLVFGVISTNVTTPEPVNPWDWQGWSYDIYWHRATSVLHIWWIGCLCFVIVVESGRLSHLSDSIESIDLLDLLPYQPLIRQGLTMMWSTKSGHRVKVVKCHNEVTDDNSNEKETELHRRLQARSSGAGYGARLQDFRSGAEPGHWG
jgi:hypothetical protein